MELGTAVTTVKGDAISVADVILHLKAKGTFRTAIYEIIEQRVIEYKLREYGVTLPQAEIDERVQARRTTLGLWDEAAFAAYLKHFGLTRDQWLETISAEMRRERLRDCRRDQGSGAELLQAEQRPFHLHLGRPHRVPHQSRCGKGAVGRHRQPDRLRRARPAIFGR